MENSPLLSEVTLLLYHRAHGNRCKILRDAHHTFRLRTVEEKNRIEHDMREQIHQLMLQKRQQEVAKQEMMANEEAWVRKVSRL